MFAADSSHVVLALSSRWFAREFVTWLSGRLMRPRGRKELAGASWS